MNKIELVLIFFTSFCVFSNWASYLLDIVGIKYFLFEIYLIPYIIYKRKQTFALIRKTFNFNLVYSTLLLIIILGILVGIINTNGDFINVITSTRSIIYIIILIHIFSHVKDININKLYILALGSIIGQLFFMMIIINYNITIWTYINVIALSLLIIIPIVQKKFIKSIISISLGITISILSGYRINIIITFCSILIGLIWIIFSKQKTLSIKKVLLKFTILSFSIYLLFLLISLFDKIIYQFGTIFNMNLATIYRITDRLQYLLSGNLSMSQDNIRIDLNRRIMTQFSNSILPKGLIDKSLGNTGIYTDVPILFLYDAFGSIVSIIIIITMLFIGTKAFIRAFNYEKNNFRIVCGLMFPILTLLLMVNGTFLNFANVAIITGVIIGGWMKYKL